MRCRQSRGRSARLSHAPQALRALLWRHNKTRRRAAGVHKRPSARGLRVGGGAHASRGRGASCAALICDAVPGRGAQRSAAATTKHDARCASGDRNGRHQPRGGRRSTVAGEEPKPCGHGLRSAPGRSVTGLRVREREEDKAGAEGGRWCDTKTGVRGWRDWGSGMHGGIARARATMRPPQARTTCTPPIRIDYYAAILSPCSSKRSPPSSPGSVLRRR